MIASSSSSARAPSTAPAKEAAPSRIVELRRAGQLTIVTLGAASTFGGEPVDQ
jgi:hypothetical protein